MTKEEFEKRYCEASGITPEEYAASLITLPCQCDYAGCQGWAAINNDELSIEVYNTLYNRGSNVI